MLEKIENVGRRLSLADIGNLERELNVRLPETYRSFLQANNGGIPTPYAFPIRGMKKNPFGLIQVFFGIDRDAISSNLAWNYRAFRKRLSPNLFAIACTGTGDLICISLSGPDKGAVVLWDAQNEPAVPSYTNVYLLEENFPDFLANIYEG